MKSFLTQKENKKKWNLETKIAIQEVGSIKYILVKKIFLSWYKKGWLLDLCLHSGCYSKIPPAGRLTTMKMYFSPL